MQETWSWQPGPRRVLELPWEKNYQSSRGRRGKGGGIKVGPHSSSKGSTRRTAGSRR
jgi:hypothetical protein